MWPVKGEAMEGFIPTNLGECGTSVTSKPK